ncbi:unnamed protein product [Rhizophagus irregularis]|nr:unnamed protein product [Rhizophagus irregularis]
MNQIDFLMMPPFRRKELIRTSGINHHTTLITKLHKNNQATMENTKTTIILGKENHRSRKTSVKADSHPARVKPYYFPYKDRWKTDTIQTSMGTRFWIILGNKLGFTWILPEMATSTTARYYSVIPQRSQQFKSNGIFSRNTETSRFRSDPRTRPTDALFISNVFMVPKKRESSDLLSIFAISTDMSPINTSKWRV